MADTQTNDAPAKSAKTEVEIVRDYWPGAKCTAIRGDDTVEIEIGDRLKSGDIVQLPAKEAAVLVRSGAATLPEA